MPTLVDVLERVSSQFSQANRTVQLTNTGFRVTHLTILLSRWLFSSSALASPHIRLVLNLPAPRLDFVVNRNTEPRDMPCELRYINLPPLYRTGRYYVRPFGELGEISPVQAWALPRDSQPLNAVLL